MKTAANATISLDTKKKIPPPAAIALKCRYNNVNGGYRLQRGHVNERCVFYNDADDKYCVYSLDDQRWVISDKRNLNEGYDVFSESDPTTGMYPTDCTWEQGIIVEEILNEDNHLDEEDNVGFEPDLRFDTKPATIGEGEDKPNAPVEWVRGPRLSPNGASVCKLFDQIEPSDVLQGALGDCWLLAAISAVAEYPNFISEQVFVEKTLSRNGRYTINLYDCKLAKWIQIMVDDRIPCRKRNWFETAARPWFAQPHGNDLYVLILEKAFAKYAGCYTNLCGGMSLYALTNLTSCEEPELWDLLDDKKAYRNIIAADFRREQPNNFQELYTIPDESVVHSLNDFWRYLVKSSDSHYIMGASIDPSGDEREHQRKDGLVEGHAYSLIRVVEDGSGSRLVQLRNPWGPSIEWNGKFSRKDDKSWAKIKDQTLHPHHEEAPDGVFYMEWGDFHTCYQCVSVCTYDMKRKKGNLKRDSVFYDKHH